MDDDAQRVLDLIDRLVRFHFVARKGAEAILAPWALIPAERSLLRDVGRDDGLTVAEIARRRGVARQSIQSLVDNLKARALLEARPHPADRRTLSLHLSAAGRAAMAQITGAELDRVRPRLAEIDPGDLAAAERLLDLFEAALGGEPATAKPRRS